MNFDIEAFKANSIQTMTSLEIAELTGKKHFSILRDIDAMLEQLYPCNSTNPDLGALVNLCETKSEFVSEYTDIKGEKRRLYKLNKEHTFCLISMEQCILIQEK